MKKITLLLVAALAFLTPVKAQDAQNVLTYQWAHTLEGAGNATNNVFEAKKSADGCYLVANKVGTKADLLTAKFDGATIEGFEGGTYGNSGAGNLYLQKINTDGSEVWHVHSTKCDVSDVKVAPTSDGGAMLFIKSRVEAKDNGVAKVLTLVGADGQATEVGDANTVIKTYYLTIAKVSQDGKWEWTRLVTGTKKGAAADCVTLGDCAVDAADNVYLAGKFVGDIKIAQSADNATTLSAHNATSDLFVFKFDKNGCYQNSLLPDENASVSSQVDKVALNGETLYLAGQVKGNGLYLADQKMEASATLSTLFLASIKTTTLNVNYVKTFTSGLNANEVESKRTFTIQNKALDYIGGNLYLTGGLNGGLTADDVTINTNSTKFKGFVVKVQASDGKALTMGINDQKEEGITNYFGVYVGESTIYALGYDMAQSSSAILFTYDKSNLAKQSEIKFSNLGSGAVNAPLLADGNKLLLMTRGKATPLTFLGTDTQFEGFSDWGVAYCLYSISDVSTGIKKISSVPNASDNVNVYTVSGVCVRQQVSPAEATLGLAKGIYVVGNKKVVVK